MFSLHSKIYCKLLPHSLLMECMCRVSYKIVCSVSWSRKHFSDVPAELVKSFVSIQMPVHTSMHYYTTQLSKAAVTTAVKN